VQRYNSFGPLKKYMADIRVNDRPGASSKPWSMLAMAAFHGHLHGRTRERFKEQKTDLVIIPNGMRSQPLDAN
jgi:hypothetical protein